MLVLEVMGKSRQVARLIVVAWFMFRGYRFERLNSLVKRQFFEINTADLKI